MVGAVRVTFGAAVRLITVGVSTISLRKHVAYTQGEQQRENGDRGDHPTVQAVRGVQAMQAVRVLHGIFFLAKVAAIVTSRRAGHISPRPFPHPF